VRRLGACTGAVDRPATRGGMAGEFVKAVEVVVRVEPAAGRLPFTADEVVVVVVTVEAVSLKESCDFRVISFVCALPFVVLLYFTVDALTRERCCAIFPSSPLSVSLISLCEPTLGLKGRPYALLLLIRFVRYSSICRMPLIGSS